MEPSLIASKNIIIKEIRVKVIQANAFTCRVFAFSHFSLVLES
jgi:hypothetical protein